MSKINKFVFSIIVAVILVFTVSIPALAALDCNTLSEAGKTIFCAGKDNITDANPFNVVIGNIVVWLVGIIGIVLTIVILYSAIQFVTSGGSPDRVKSAKDRLVQAAVSLGLLISFNAIFDILNNNIFKGITGTSLGEVKTLGNNVILVLLTVVGALSVIFIIIGGIQYTISAGDSNKVSTAKSTITYAIIGLVMSLSIGIVISLLNLLIQ
jgi:hypothetical protein